MVELKGLTCPVCSSGPLSLVIWMDRVFLLECEYGDFFLDPEDLGVGGVAWSGSSTSGEIAPGLTLKNAARRDATLDDIRAADDDVKRRWEPLLV